MRISWLEPDLVRAARAALAAHRADHSQQAGEAGWAAHFTPRFEPPPAPPGIDPGRWPHIAEHVARAERVSEEIRARGLAAAMMAFRTSGQAIELATLVSAAVQVDQVTFELVAALLGCEIDDLVIYGPFLELLQQLGGRRREQALGVYERFCAAFAAKSSEQPMWRDRVDAVRDGLAGFYVHCGRYDQAHALFEQRHREDARTLVVALGASRAFLAAGAVGRAVTWLGLGADRAGALGRDDMAARLRAKQDTLRARQS
jgi:hypothetical protein